ncbi:MAG: hypothetical protein ACP5OG_00650 [Candidatus Nanoarchaeia archaeon]
MEKQIWTLDRDLEETKNKLSLQHKLRINIWETRENLLGDVSLYQLKTNLGEVYESLDKKLNEIRYKKEDLEEEINRIQDPYVKGNIGFMIQGLEVDRHNAIETHKAPLLKAVSGLDENLRLTSAYALDKKGFLRFSCYNDFDHYKTPSNCGKCVEAYKNLTKTGLTPFFKFIGDRVYRTDKDEIENIILYSVSGIKNQEARDSYLEKISQYKKLEKPDYKLIEELEAKSKSLEMYKQEENQKIRGFLEQILDQIGKEIEIYSR